MTKSKKCMESNDNFFPRIKHVVGAKTSTERLYFKNIEDSKKSRFALRSAKVKRHKTSSLVLCIRCGNDNVRIDEKVTRSADEGSTYACKCQDCGKGFQAS